MHHHHHAFFEATEIEDESPDLGEETATAVWPDDTAGPDLAPDHAVMPDAVPMPHEEDAAAPAASSSGDPRRVEQLSRQVMHLHTLIHDRVDPMVAKGGKKHSRPTTRQEVSLGLNQCVFFLFSVCLLVFCVFFRM